MLFGNNAINVGKVAGVLVVIEAVSNDEIVGNFHANIINGIAVLKGFWLEQKRSNFNCGRF